MVIGGGWIGEKWSVGARHSRAGGIGYMGFDGVVSGPWFLLCALLLVGG